MTAKTFPAVAFMLGLSVFAAPACAQSESSEKIQEQARLSDDMFPAPPSGWTIVSGKNNNPQRLEKLYNETGYRANRQSYSISASIALVPDRKAFLDILHVPDQRFPEGSVVHEDKAGKTYFYKIKGRDAYFTGSPYLSVLIVIVNNTVLTLGGMADKETLMSLAQLFNYDKF